MSDAVTATIQNPAEYRLCFVADQKAYFTNADDFSELRTEDWDKQYGMGFLHGTKPESTAEVKTVLFTGPLKLSNCNLSPQRRNNGELVWIGSTTSADEIVSINAKTPLPTFISQVSTAGGTTYIPVTE